MLPRELPAALPAGCRRRCAAGHRGRRMRIVSFERRREREHDRSGRTRRAARRRRLRIRCDRDPRRGARRLGALMLAGPDAGSIVDLSRALAVKLAREDAGAPEAEAESLIPSDPHRLPRRGPARARGRARRARVRARRAGALRRARPARGRHRAAAPARSAPCARAAPGQDRRRRAQLSGPRARARRRSAAPRSPCCSSRRRRP